MASFLWATVALAGSLFFGPRLLSTFSFNTKSNSVSDITPLVSGGAEIYFPGSAGFQNATARWSAAANPVFGK